MCAKMQTGRQKSVLGTTDDSVEQTGRQVDATQRNDISTST